MGVLPLPSSVDEITPDWLTAALREGGAPCGATVAQVSAQVIAEDRGFTGVIARLVPRYDGEPEGRTAPTSLIAKLPLARRRVASAYRLAVDRDPERLRQHYQLAAREVRFYREIAPSSALLTPRLYFAAADGQSGRVILLLEDLSAARAVDALLGCTPDEAARVIEAIAPFHAQWWAQPHKDRFPWLLEWAGDPQAQQQRYNRQLDAFLPRFGPQLPLDLLDLLDRLRSRYAQALGGWADTPATLIHADLHLDNILLDPQDTARPIILLDWQGISIGPAVADMALFVIGALDPDKRRRTADDLFRRYHALLVAHGVSGYSLDHLRQHARLALLRRLAGTVAWLSNADLPELTRREQAAVLAAFGDGRLVCAVRDFGVAELVRG